jgi:thiol-disulfide isomerase/thioredoxin
MVVGGRTALATPVHDEKKACSIKDLGEFPLRGLLNFSTVGGELVDGGRRWATRARGRDRAGVKRPQGEYRAPKSGRHDRDERDRDRDQEHVFNQGLPGFGVPLSHPFYFRLESGGMATDSQAPETPRKKPTVASVLVPVAVVLAGVLFTLGYLRERAKTHDLAEHAIAGATDGAVSRKVGDSLPDLTFHKLDGTEVKLSDLKSKVVVINFWATWCGPCVKELPSLQNLSNEYAARGLTVIGVNLDDDPSAVLTPFLTKHEIKFQSFVDPSGTLADRFAISGLPLTIVVDGNRKILLEQMGDEEWFAPEFRKQFELWLAGTNSG